MGSAQTLPETTLHFMRTGQTQHTRGEKYVEAKIARVERGGSDVTRDPQTIEIVDQPIRDPGVILLAEYLAQPGCRCEKLVLDKVISTSTGFYRLVQGLEINNSVKEFGYLRNQIGDRVPAAYAEESDRVYEDTMAMLWGEEGAHRLASVLRCNPCLTSIHLEDNFLGDDGFIALADGLMHNSTVQVLRILSNRVGDRGMRKLGGAIRVNKTLVSLDFEDNFIGDEGGHALWNGLQANESVTCINLRANQLTASSCSELGLMLQANNTLRELNLRRNRLRDEGCELLAPGLAANSMLSSLHLSSNLVGCRGCSELARHLHANATLQTLSLEVNEISDRGGAALAEVLLANRTLTEIDLRMNHVESSCEVLADAVEQSTSIKKLLLSGSTVSTLAAVERINAKLGLGSSLIAQVEKEAQKKQREADAVIVGKIQSDLVNIETLPVAKQIKFYLVAEDDGGAEKVAVSWIRDKCPDKASQAHKDRILQALLQSDFKERLQTVAGGANGATADDEVLVEKAVAGFNTAVGTINHWPQGLQRWAQYKVSQGEEGHQEFATSLAEDTYGTYGIKDCSPALKAKVAKRALAGGIGERLVAKVAELKL